MCIRDGRRVTRQKHGKGAIVSTFDALLNECTQTNEFSRINRRHYPSLGVEFLDNVLHGFGLLCWLHSGTGR